MNKGQNNDLKLQENVNGNIMDIDFVTACHLLQIQKDEAGFAIFDQERIIPAISYPIRLGAYGICICTGGHATFSMNLIKTTIGKNCITTITPKDMVQILDISGDFRGTFILSSYENLIGRIQDTAKVKDVLLQIRKRNCLQLDNADGLEMYLDCINAKKEEKDNRYRTQIYEKLIQALFYEICNIVEKKYGNQTALIPDRKSEIFDGFITLVSENIRKERKLSYYASRLCITPKYLSACIKSVSGKTAGEIIDSMLLIEARNLLAYTPMNISQISLYLNFPDQSTFGKYFRNLTGESPMGFRKKIRKTSF